MSFRSLILFVLAVLLFDYKSPKFHHAPSPVTSKQYDKSMLYIHMILEVSEEEKREIECIRILCPSNS